MRFFFLYLACSLAFAIAAQETSIYNDDPMQKLPLGTEEAEYRIRQPSGLTELSPRVEPPNWWTGMKNTHLEILLYDRNITDYTTATIDVPGIEVDYLKRLENPNYLFLGLDLSASVPAQSFTIQLQGPAGTLDISYELLPHPRDSQGREQLSGADLIYLIMPDRFANGDPNNDSIEGMAQTGTNREKFLFRHGGDLQGIRDRLDYLADLGATAIWLNPVLENDQPYESYHGYAITDHYRIDRRFGSNEDYQTLVQEAHGRGIKVIMDVIFNHVGDHHWFIEDLPSSDWIHQWPEYTQTTYRATTLLDPHASEHDRKLMTDGWFDKHMPDLNQQQPQLANYLIQNSIWWTLFSGQDAFRIDTYAYPDPDFMAEWNRRMLAEFPELGIYGETWVHGPAVQAWFTGGRQIHDDFDTHLPGVTDFQVYYAIHEAMAQNPGWTDGIMRLYYTLAQDYLYTDPGNNVTFLDNHDLARMYTTFGGDLTKIKSGLALLLTLRGIPMLYYGTELGFAGSGGGFGEGGRVDFPGGFAGDERNLFDPTQRNATESELFEFTKNLANFRKISKALQQGELIQFVPRDGVYTYFRRHEDERVMVLFNGKDEAVEDFSLATFAKQLGGAAGGVDITEGRVTIPLDKITLAPKETKVILIQ